MAVYILIAIISYLIGGIMPAIILTKKIKGFDVREKGSNNAGSTNVLRTAGKKVAILTLIADVLKGSAAVLLSLLFAHYLNLDNSIVSIVSAISVVIGHTFPIYFGFKGGKGVATSIGAVLVINPTIVLIVVLFALSIIIFTRLVSVASIFGALLFPILMIFLNDKNTSLVQGNSNIYFILFAIFIALFVVFNHRTNIKKLKNGEERKITISNKE